jgi:hypothetical protein
MLFRHDKQKKPVPDTEETRNKCHCTECLTNPDGTVSYCARGITKKPIDQVRALGCNCVFCPIYHEHKLAGCYLCLNPPARTS